MRLLSRFGAQAMGPQQSVQPATSTRTPSARPGLIRKFGVSFGSAACVRTPPIRRAMLNALAATAPMAPTTKIASYVSMAVSSASVTRQPDDAPNRSTPYTRLIFCELRVNARLTATPSRTYGGSNTRRVSVHETTKLSVGSKVGMTANQERACRHTEHGNADCDKRQRVTSQHGQHARLDDLQHQKAHTSQKDAGEKPKRVRVGCLHQEPHSASLNFDVSICFYWWCRLRDYSALRASPLRGRPAGDQLGGTAKLSNPACFMSGVRPSCGSMIDGGSKIFAIRCRLRDSNPRPTVYKTVALPLC